MSRKDYVAVAEIIKSAVENERLGGDIATAEITRELALMFKRDNPNFNAGRFFDAAGFPELTGTRMGLN